MKTLITLITGCVLFTACQKSVPDITSRTNSSDTLTYEVLTTDTGGWFGAWNLPEGIVGNALDSITFGSPIYLPSGWRYSFAVPANSFQALLSAASRSYSDDITVNLYKNGRLIKSVTNDAMKGVAKLMYDVPGDTLVGTAADPVLTYEVLISEPDATQFESDAWVGRWKMANGVYDDSNNRLLQSFLFAIPSGWRYSFKPDHRPFTMSMQAAPYSVDGGKITVNFFVNGQLVKTSSARDWIYVMEYVVP